MNVQNSFPTTGPSKDSTPAPPEPALYQSADVARQAPCCVATVRRVADFLNLPVTRTGSGQRIFTRDQARAIITEIQKRRTEIYK